MINLYKEEWKQRNDPTLPTTICYYPTGQVQTRVWRDDRGKMHRVNNELALIEYDQNGIITNKEYYIDGDLVECYPSY